MEGRAEVERGPDGLTIFSCAPTDRFEACVRASER
jgi:hypothetical protein